MPRHPNVLWAQRRDHVYLTIDLQVKKEERRVEREVRLVFFSARGSGSDGRAQTRGPRQARSLPAD